jgi:hypothetical protein
MEILNTHRPEPSPDDTDRAINEIAKKAVGSLAGKHFSV